MNCEEPSRFLDAYLDRELEAGKRIELEQHLSGCGDRKVGVLIYKRNEDLVSLFAWPAADWLLAAKDWSVSGYRACTWHAANFNFVAVSTLSDHDFDEVTDQIRDRLK